MNKLMLAIGLSLLVIHSCFALDLPYRKDYPGVTTIETEELYKRIQEDSVIVVDVRSEHEYQTLRILGAAHIPLGNIAFANRIKALRSGSNKTIVFYCNGVTCKKSYKAGIEASKVGVRDTLAFDAGISTWAKTYPTYTELLGKNLVTKNRLLSAEKFSQHTLPPEEFKRRVYSNNVLVIDIREPALRTIKLFPERTRNIPAKRFEDAIDYARSRNSTLLIYDFVGKQLPWLQYKLEDKGVKDYYFLQGGVENYKAYMDAENL